MNSDAPTKTVKWSDQHEDWRNEDSSEEEEEESEDDDSEEDDSEDNDREDEQTTLSSVINFRHTVVEAKDVSDSVVCADDQMSEFADYTNGSQLFAHMG